LKNKRSEGTMDRAEALAVMHEIFGALRESVIASGVSLDYSGPKISKDPEDILIKMKCNLDDYSRECIQPILDKRNLKLEAKKGTVVIYSQ
jgi:hypothetical protein